MGKKREKKEEMGENMKKHGKNGKKAGIKGKWGNGGINRGKDGETGKMGETGKWEKVRGELEENGGRNKGKNE